MNKNIGIPVGRIAEWKGKEVPATAEIVSISSRVDLNHNLVADIFFTDVGNLYFLTVPTGEKH
jgi:hypothetical protein